MAQSAQKLETSTARTALELDELNGVDRLMLALDPVFLKHSGRGNICSLHVQLAARVTATYLENYFNNNQLYQSLVKIRLKKYLIPRWQSNSHTKLPKIQEYRDISISDLIKDQSIDPIHQAPFRIIIVQEASCTSLLFIWHHALVDAHGGEDLILAMITEITQQSGKHRGKKSFNLKNNLIEAYQAKNAIFTSAKPPLLTFKVNNQTENLHYHQIKIDGPDLLKLKNTYSKTNSELFTSSLHLAASCRAVFKTFYSDVSYEKQFAFHIPVPHDLRRSNILTLGNQLTFLFYRINTNQLIRLRSAYHAVITQAEDQIRSSLHVQTRSFFDLIRYLPDTLIRKLVFKPTSGAFASFFFSDTGSSLSRFNNCINNRITEISHYPPHFIPPGFSVVFSRFKEQLKIVVVCSHRHIDKLTDFQSHLLNDLLNGGDNE